MDKIYYKRGAHNACISAPRLSNSKAADGFKNFNNDDTEKQREQIICFWIEGEALVQVVKVPNPSLKSKIQIPKSNQNFSYLKCQSSVGKRASMTFHDLLELSVYLSRPR